MHEMIPRLTCFVLLLLLLRRRRRRREGGRKTVREERWNEGRGNEDREVRKTGTDLMEEEGERMEDKKKVREKSTRER